MNTITAATSTGQTTAPPAVDIDFDTRLTMASIGIDVLLSRHGLEETHAAVTTAVAEPDGYGAEALRLDALKATQHPQLYRSQPVLKRAGDLIRERGWTQRNWSDPGGAICAWQAVKLAAGDDPYAERDAVAVLLDRIRHELGSWAEGLSVSGWNDRRDRTKDQVLSLLW